MKTSLSVLREIYLNYYRPFKEGKDRLFAGSLQPIALDSAVKGRPGHSDKRCEVVRSDGTL